MIHRSRSTSSCGWLGLVLILCLASQAAAAGPAMTTLQLKELSKGSTFAFIDNAPKSTQKGEPSASVGDELVFSNPLTSMSGRKLGHLYMHCTAVLPSHLANKATYSCGGAVALADGTMTVQVLLRSGNIGSGKTVYATVTGGTGAFANMRGVVVSRQTASGANDTVTLVS